MKTRQPKFFKIEYYVKVNLIKLIIFLCLMKGGAPKVCMYIVLCCSLFTFVVCILQTKFQLYQNLWKDTFYFKIIKMKCVLRTP